jgi:hypothetical protein
MPYTVALPDGRTVEFPDSVSREQAAEIIRKQLNTQTPKEGLIAGFQKGAESTFSQMRSGLGALVGSGDEAAKAGLARGEDIGQRYADQVSLDKVKQAYADKGLLSAAGEVISQVPAAVAEQVPNLISSAGSARLGALAGSPFGPAGSLIGGGVGLIAPSVIQALGGNVERQAAEGQPVSVGKALPAAALQGGLDVVGNFIPLGGRLVSKLTGLPVEALLGRSSAQVSKLADERLLATLAKGTATGVLAEIPTEITQQMLERAQAGLSLSSPDALKEYGETAYQAGLLGPVGAVGRYSQRSDAQETQAKERRTQEVELVKQQNAEAERVKAEQEAYKQTPDFLKDISQRYEALQTKLKDLDTRASTKPDKNDLVAQADVREARQERDALKKADETEQLIADYRSAAPRIKAMREEEEQARLTTEGMKTQGAQADLFGAPTVQDQTPLAQLQALAPRIKDLDAQIKTAQKAGDTQQLAALGNQRQQLQNTIQPLLPTRTELTDSRAALERYLAESRGRMQTAETTADIERHAQQAQQYKSALDQLAQYEPYVEAAPNLEATRKKIKELQGSLTKARELGDQDQVLKILPKLRELEGQIEKPLFYEDAKNLQRLTKEGKYPEPQEPYEFRGRQYVKDFFDYDEIISDKELADEMAAGRERAQQIRESFEAESAKLRGFAERKGARTPAEQALFDMRTDEARKLRDQFAKGEQDWSKLGKSPENTQYQQDRVDLQKKLKERVVDLQMELDRAPEAPAEADTFEKEMAAIKDRVLSEGEKPPRFKSAVQKELEVTQQSLANLESRIAIGERYRKKGAVADNIITKETDKNISDLLDRLLPGALEKASKTDKTGKPEIFRTNTGDDGVRTIVKKDGKVTKNVTRYRYDAVIDGEPQTLRVEKDNQTGKVIAQFEMEGRPFGDLQIGALVEQGMSPEDAIKRVIPDLEKLNLIKPEPQKTESKATRVTQLPIQSAQDQLTRLKEAEALLKSLNKQIQAAGKPKDPAKIEALDALKDQREDVQQEIAAAQKAYNRLVELEQPRAAPEAEPTQGDLFGGLEESKAEINALDKKLDGLYNDLKLAQAESNRLGAEPETPQLKALVEKFQKRPSPRVKEIQADIERLESRRESATGKRSQQYVDYLKAREEETAVPEGQRAFDKRLSGFKEEILKPVAKEELDTARTKYVELQSTVEGIRAALSKQDSDGGKSLREVATRLQLELENKTQEFGGTFGGFGKKSTVTEAKAKAIQAEYAPRIQRLLNMSRMAAAAKNTGVVPKALQTALDKAQADQAKAKSTLDGLESKQRAYEQQQAVITGATPGKAEAERLLAGEGYRNVAGFVRTTPKKKESWGITSVPKAKAAKPTEVAKAVAEVEKAASLVQAAEKMVFKETPTTVMTAQDRAEKAQTLKALKEAQKAAGGDTDPSNPAVALRNKLARDVAEAYATERATKTTPIVPAAIQQAKDIISRLQAAVDALDPQANGTFSPEKSTEVYTEIQDLQEEIGRFGTQEQFDGLSAIIRGIDLARVKKGAAPANLYLAPLKRYEGMLKNTEAQVAALDAKLNQLKAEYDTIAKNEGEKAPVVVEADLADVIARATPVDQSHTKAVLAYKIARRDMLAYQYELGKDVREQYRAAVQALQAEVERQGKDATLPAAIKERDAAVAKLKETQDRLAAAETKLNEAQGKARGAAKAAETLAPTAEQAEEAAREARRLAILRGDPTELQNLPALRVERDTTTPLAQAVQSNAKRMLGLSRAALESATTAKEREEATLAVQRYERELAQAFESGERKVTATGEYAGKADTDEDIFETQKPVPGERLGARREGPLVREARQAPGQFLGAALDVKQGSQNPPRQAGAIKLRASDLNPESANAISLVTLKGKLDAAKEGTKRKTTLENQYKLATEGLTDEQIRDRMVEGQRLMASGETLEVIAANENRREARLELVQAESYLRTAKTPAAKEIAQDDVDTKQAAYDAADRKYEAAKTAAASQGFKGTERADVQAADAVEEDLTSTPQSRLGKAFEDSEDSGLVATKGSTEVTALSEDALGELFNGSLVYSLNQIAKSSPTPFIRENAAKLEKFVRKTKVEVVPVIYDKDGNSVPAAYNPSRNTILLTKDGLNENDVIHEVTHAATMSALVLPESELAAPQLAAKRELKAIFGKVKSMRRFKNEYAITDLKEFVSEVQSNVDLRKMLDKQPWYKGTMFEGFIRAVQRLLGVKPIDIGSERTAKLIEDLYMQSRNLSSAQVSAASRIDSAFVGSSPGRWESFKGNLFGLAGRVQLVDRLAAADKAIVEAEGAGKLTSTEAFQTQYFMRTADQTTQAAGQFLTYGPVKIVSEQRSTGVEYRYQSESGANLLNVSEHLGEAAKAGGLSSQEAERMLTSIIAGERAASMLNGWARLQSANPDAAKAEYERDVAYLKTNPEVRQSMDAAKAEYKKFNDGLIDFVTQCGAISKEDAEIFKGRPYIPFYRVDNDVVKLFTDSEKSITIGNIKDSPDLQRMLGDNKHILPVLTSAAQNAFMLTRMGLQNQATKTTADAMFKAGFATKIGKGAGPADANTVHYKIDGKPAFAVIDADTFGIPAHLIVKGMEGIKTTIPALVQMMGVPADILRKFVTRSPAYVVRQLIRDPVNASLLAGVDGVPMLNALREISKMRYGRSQSEEALMRGLAISSNVYSGNEKDMQKFLQDIASGKGKWEKMLGWLDTIALQADAATRATIYQDSLKKGLSEAQAQFRALESQNFSRRGLSPSMQMLSTMIPFFNAQVQGLDVLYRSLRGRMPFSERLDIQRKIAARGTMLTTVALAYALSMQDDEAYKKASPEERYNNFFVRIPGVNDPLKIPIPYEAGLLFKALPEAILDAAMRDTKAKEAALGMGKLILQSTPGVIPIGGKPLIEAFYGQTAFGPIESPREKQLQAGMRYRETTSEIAKVMGSATGVVGVSPLMLEHLVRGYTGSLGIAAIHMLDPLLRSSSAGQKPSLSAAQLPFVGGLFQKEEGRWLIDRAYDRMDEVVQAQKTFEDLVTRGQGAEARAFAQKFSNKLALADDAGSLRKEMGELYSMERAIRVNPNLTTEQKDLRIAQLKKLQNKMAEQFTTAVDRTTPR